MPHQNYILFIRECEYRFIISELTKKKEKNFRNLFQTVYKLNSFEFYDEDELLNYLINFIKILI